MIEFPIHVRSTANLREHWSATAKRAKLHRQIVGYVMNGQPKPDLPCIVRFIRIAPRELDDDNCVSGFKACRDGFADWLGIKDNDPRVSWEYAQIKGKPRQYAVRVEIQPPLPGV